MFITTDHKYSFWSRCLVFFILKEVIHTQENEKKGEFSFAMIVIDQISLHGNAHIVRKSTAH